MQTVKLFNGTLQADLSCRHTRQSVGHIFTRTNFVTLKYVTDAWGTEANGFHLVITAFKDKSTQFYSPSLVLECCLIFFFFSSGTANVAVFELCYKFGYF